MARVLKIEGYLNDGTTDLVTVDFQTNLVLDELGWETEVTLEDTWERMTVYSNNADSDLRSYAEDLDQLGEAAREYILEPVRPNPVWFYWQGEGESTRRSVVTDVRTRYLNTSNAASPLQGFDQAYLSVAIYHLPWYEGSTLTTDYQAGSSDFPIFGGTWSPGNAAGSVNQRIKRLTLSSTDGSPYTQVWVGIRNLNQGSSGFVALWEAEDGTNATTDTVAVGPVAGASNAAALEIDFSSTEAMAHRTSLPYFSVYGGPDYNHLVGKYLVLGSFKLGSTDTECRVRLSQSWFSANVNASIVGETLINVTNYPKIAEADGYKFVELGRVQIPPEGYRENWVASGGMDIYTLSLSAQRVAGTGSLFYDCLILIPADHLFSAKFHNTLNYVSTGGHIAAYTSPEGRQWARMIESDNDVRAWPYEYTFENWEYPLSGGVLVYAAQTDSDHPTSGFMDVGLELLPRWRSYRP